MLDFYNYRLQRKKEIYSYEAPDTVQYVLQQAKLTIKHVNLKYRVEMYDQVHTIYAEYIEHLQSA